ncbi:MAG: polyprenyl synthetase family protein, partial [Chitinivibrionales bacterium]
MKSRDPEKLKAYLEKTAGIIEESVDDLLPMEDAHPESIHSVMRHSIFAGGKRIRPALLFAANEACGGDFGNRDAVVTASALEMLHTFSLMHDDLPCMDDDDFRRGKPTAHKAFNEAIAILGGDALCIFAFEVLSRTGRADIIGVISSALGTRGMIAGQVVDIESENMKVNKDIVNYIHMNKTAALIRASILSGAMLADASDEE